jgi:hypothetical protein
MPSPLNARNAAVPQGNRRIFFGSISDGLSLSFPFLTAFAGVTRIA